MLRTTVLRNILDRLIYDKEYSTVDSNLTDCNVGSRKKRNIRDNLFVMNSVMNSSRKGIDSPCDICVYDVRKCFDSLWLAECVNDLFEAGLTNNKLCILYYQNKNASIAIKTPHGTTERFVIQNVVRVQLSNSLVLEVQLSNSLMLEVHLSKSLVLGVQLSNSLV